MLILLVLSLMMLILLINFDVDLVVALFPFPHTHMTNTTELLENNAKKVLFLQFHVTSAQRVLYLFKRQIKKL